MNFHENSSSECRNVKRGRTDRYEKCLNITQKNVLKRFLELNGVQEWRLLDVSANVAVFISQLMNLAIFGRVPYINSEGCGKVAVTLQHTTHWQICIRAPDSNCNFCRNVRKFSFMPSNTGAEPTKWTQSRSPEENSRSTNKQGLKGRMMKFLVEQTV